MSEGFAEKDLFIEQNRTQLQAIITLSSSLAEAPYNYALDWAKGHWTADPELAQPLHDDARDLILDVMESIYEARFPQSLYESAGLGRAGTDMDEVKTAHITHRQLFDADKVAELRAECFRVETSGKYGVAPFSITGVEICRENMYVSDTLLIAQADDDLIVDHMRLPVEDGDLFRKVVEKTAGYEKIRNMSLDAMTGDIRAMASLEQLIRQNLGKIAAWRELLDDVQLRHHMVLAENGPLPPWDRPSPVILEKAASALVALVATQA